MGKDTDELFIEVISKLEEAKNGIEAMRALRQDEVIDGRSLSIAVTNLETAQLWVANARK
jgi:hypothetical protein